MSEDTSAFVPQVLYENEDYLVINKPSGLSIHSESGPGLIALVRQYFGDNDIFPVHRLDAVTSGLLLLAKNQLANRALSQMFQGKKIKKIYLALLDKKPQKTQGAIIGDMLKARGGSWRLAQTKANPAQTWFFSNAYAPGKRFAILKPLTGKTHQLRVAMKALGAPILGDERYGGSTHVRTCLHAWQLRFSWKGEDVHYSAPFSKTEGETESEFDSKELAGALDAMSSPFDLAWPQAANPDNA